MELSTGIRTRRRRTEHGRRSKQGCRTCISKKVKCDEQHPICGRCVRLSLDCEWATQVSSLASRRRGWGSIRDRDSWIPPPISPKPDGGVGEQQAENDVRVLVDSPGDLQNIALPKHHSKMQSSNLPLNSYQETPTACDRSAAGTVVMPASLDTDNEIAVSPSMRQNTGDVPNLNPQQMARFESTNQQPSKYSNMPMSLSLLSDPLSPSRFSTASSAVLPGALPSVMVGGSDLQAVNFHRVVFAPLKSTRTAAVSAHSIFLDRALSNSMALHFLLAVSHSELAIHQGHGIQTPSESWQHFNRGSKLLFDAGKTVTQSDHVSVLLSFLYMYMFWMRRDPFNQAMLRELSRSVLAYVKTYNLDDLCATAGLSTLEDSSLPDKVLLSRILTYLYDRDGFCYFFGCGGAFATYVNENHEKRGEIWRLSHMGFPWSDSNDLVTRNIGPPTRAQDAKITEVYFQLIAIHHDINCYSQDFESQVPGLELKITSNLDRLEKEQRCLLEMVANCRGQTSTPCLMTLVTVTFFYALQVYFYRSRNSAFGELPVPARVQKALSELVSTAYYTVATGPVQLLERFQWALLIAGIETYDPVHQEWISRNIADPGMKSVLQVTVDARKMHCISMHAIRQLVSGVTFST